MKDNHSGFTDDSSLYFLSIIFDTFTQGVFKVLFELNKRVVNYRWTTTIVFIIEFMQILSFHFPLKELTSLRSSFAWPTTWTDWISYVSAAFQITPFMQTNRDQLTVLGAFAILFISMFLFLSLVVWWLVVEKIKNNIIVEALRHYAILLFGVALIPLLNALFLQVPCIGETNGALGCWSGSGLILSSLSVIFGAILIVLAVLYELTVFSRDPTSDSAISCPHSRPQVFWIIMKSIYCVMFSIFYDTPSIHWLLMVILVVGNISCGAVFSHLLPYYNWTFNHIRCNSIFLLSWVSIVLLVNFVYPSAAAPFVLYIFFPIVLLGGIMFLQNRKGNLLHCDVIDCESPYEIELKVRFVMEDVTNYMIRKKIDFGHYMLYDEHIPTGYSYETLPSDEEMQDAQQSQKVLHEKLLDETNEIYQHGLRRFPVALMILFRAFYCYCYNQNTALAQHALTRADTKRPKFDEDFSIQVLRALYNETTDSNQHDIVSFISWQQNQESARREDENATRFQLTFWNELLLSNPDLNRLQELATKIGSAISIAQEAFVKLLKLNSSSTQVLRMYASFMLDVQNQPERAQIMSRRADELEETQSRMHRDNSDFSLLDDRAAVISISGDKDHLGDILNVNYGVVSLFGYSLHELLTGNIIRLMCSPYSIHHTAFMQRYFETGTSTFLNKKTLLFGMHKSGFLIPIEIFIREIASSSVTDSITSTADVSQSTGTTQNIKNTSTFVGVIQSSDLESVNIGTFQHGAHQHLDDDTTKKRRKNEEELDSNEPTKPEFAALDGHFSVTTCTQGFARIFGLDIYEIRAGNVKISSCIPEFLDCVDEGLQSNAGSNVAVTLENGTSVKINATMTKIPVRTDFYYLLQVNIPLNLGFSEQKKEIDEALNLDAKKRREAATAAITQEVNSKLPKTPSKMSKNNGEHDSMLEMQPLVPAVDSNKNGDQASQHSGGSGASAASTNSIANLHGRIQSFSKSSEQRGLGAGLRYLQLILLFSIVLLTITSIVKFVLVGNALTDYMTSINDVTNAGLARFTLAKILYEVHYITYAAQSADPTYNLPNLPGLLSSDEAKLIQSGILASDAVSLGRYLDLLFINRPSISSDVYSAFTVIGTTSYAQKNINNNLIPSWGTSRLWDALKAYIGSATSVSAYTNLGQVKDTQDATFNILYNGVNVYLPAMDNICSLEVAYSQSLVNNIKTISLTVSIISILMVFFMILFAVKPIVWTVDDNKQSVLVLFTEIPFSFLLSFKKKCEDRLTRLQRAREEFLNAGFTAESDVEDNEDDQNAVNVTVEDEKSGGKENIAAGAAAKKGKIITSSATFDSRHLTLLRISSILAATIVYFVVTYWVEFGGIESKLNNLPSTVNYGQQRWSMHVVNLFYLRRLLLQNYTLVSMNGSPHIGNVTTEFVNSQILNLLSLESNMAYGSSSLGIMEPSGTEIDAYFGATCGPIDTYTPYASNCESFHQGIMNHGMHVAFVQSIDLMQQLSSEITKISGSGLNNDFSVLNATFNGDSQSTIAALQNSWLPPLVTFANNLYVSTMQSTVDQVYSIRLALLCLFLLGSYAMFLVFFNPLVWSLNSEQKRTITLLLMIPPSVMEKMSSLRSFVEKIASQTVSD